MDVDVAALLAALPTRISDIPARLAARDPQHVVLIEDERCLNAAELVRKPSTTPPASSRKPACEAAIA